MVEVGVRTGQQSGVPIHSLRRKRERSADSTAKLAKEGPGVLKTLG